MDAIADTSEPQLRTTVQGEEAVVRFTGDWWLPGAQAAEDAVNELEIAERRVTHVVLDLSAVGHLDTSGAWLVHRLRGALEYHGRRVTFAEMPERVRFLVDEVETHLPPPVAKPRRPLLVLRWLDGMGRTTVEIWHDTVAVVSILGAFVASLLACIGHLSRMRGVSILANFDQTCRGAVPIVVLMSFIVGLIIAQQGGVYLRQFGADVFVVDLVGILVLRELGVLLTAIMVAGRSGSAFTAEIGSMRMREEVDALKVIGLDPIDVLVVPRLIALILALPVLTFIANVAAIAGGGIVAWFYLNIPPEAYLQRLHEAVTIDEFIVGMVKAPVMALIIGLIGCIEGLKVKGSAESLGRHTTTSVVKAIFMVIIVDGLFAMYFAAIDL